MKEISISKSTVHHTVEASESEMLPLKKSPKHTLESFCSRRKNKKNLRFKRFGELKCSDAPVQKPGDVLGEPSITFPGGVSECNAKKLEAPKTNLSVGCFLMAEDVARDYTKMNGCFRPDFKQTKQKKKTQNAKFPDQERHIGLAFEIRETCFFGQSFS